MINTKAKKPSIYKLPKSNYLMEIADEPLNYIIPCPNCTRRVFDISDLPERSITVQLKCPHCRKIVATSLLCRA